MRSNLSISTNHSPMPTFRLAVTVAAVIFLITLSNASAQYPAAPPAMLQADGPIMAMPPVTSPDCFSVVPNASDCLTYVEMGSNLTKPDKGCCPELAGVVESNPICLCDLIGNSDSFGVQVDQSRALNLPSICGVSLCQVAEVPIESPMSGPTESPISDYQTISTPQSSSSTSVGTVVGIAAAVMGFIFVVAGILWWKGCIGRRNTMAQDIKGLDLQTGSFTFTLRQIKVATNNFDAANKIGEGGFGPVYKGHLADGTIIAVKQLSSKSKQGNREFVNEIGMISALQHPNLVKLYGCCMEGNQLILVYEYMENNSLARALFGLENCQLKLDWPTRHKICVGIARGLAYLHEESRLKIVHRDIKTTNVLLDKNLDPKISDFGLARLDDEDNTHISTRIAGTYGYMAPEYAMRGHLTDKADVYSFGIVALEIVSGKSNILYRSKEKSYYLLDWALELKEEDNIMELVDTSFGSDFDKEQALTMISVSLLCTNHLATSRPSMSAVVSMLEGRIVVQEPVLIPSVSKEEIKINEMKDNYEHSKEHNKLNFSTDKPSTASSSSAPNLYPVNLDSDYWKSRD